MPNQPLCNVFRFLRRALAAPNAHQLTDGELLERFTGNHDDAAFEALIQRHGPLVWGVCRRGVYDAQDAEDAFQATFLVLLRKARSLLHFKSLGSWLHGVGYRIALNANTAAGRRRRREREAALMADTQVRENDGWEEVRPVLDAELHKLPAKYRAPLVLCYLQGKTNEQAARELGWPIGSMSKKLARGRELLRERLEHRGVALASAALGAILSENAATAAVPAGVVDGTLRVAHLLVSIGNATTAGVASTQVSALTEGVLQAMWISKLSAIAALVVAAVCLAGSGLFVHQVLADRPPAAAEAPDEPQAAAPAAEKETGASKHDLTSESLPKLHALIRPQDNEWRHLRVRWLTDPVAALKKAAAEDKPMVYLYLGGAGYNAPLGAC